MIDVYMQKGRLFVWNANDVVDLWKKHGIMGNLVGCFPRLTFQNARKGLPLQLMDEEAKLLVEMGIGRCVTNPALCRKRTEEEAQHFWQTRDKLNEEQVALAKDKRLEEIREKADEITAAKRKSFAKGFRHKGVSKRRKLDQEEAESSTSSDDGGSIPEASGEQHEVDEDTAVAEEASESEKAALLEEELARTPNFTRKNCVVQLFTECLWKEQSENALATSFHFPINERERLRFAVFKDLWRRGYYLTTGTKFGGDFLCYAGFPQKYHAMYIVLCVDSRQELRAQDLIRYGRVAHQTKKTYVLASCSPLGRGVEYVSLNWSSSSCHFPPSSPGVETLSPNDE